MIVGVLLFTPLLLLLPTTFVYYVLALGLHCGAYFTCQALQLITELLHLNPVFFAWCWAFRPGLVSGMPSVCAEKLDQSCLGLRAVKRFCIGQLVPCPVPHSQPSILGQQQFGLFAYRGCGICTMQADLRTAHPTGCLSSCQLENGLGPFKPEASLLPGLHSCFQYTEHRKSDGDLYAGRQSFWLQAYKPLLQYCAELLAF